MRNLPTMERLVRRSHVYRGRVGRLILQKRLSHPCAFMHLPKCGGTSLSEGLYALVPLNLKIGILDTPSIRRGMAIYHDGVDDLRSFHDEGDKAGLVSAFREQLLLMHMAHGAHLIHGHFLFSDRAFEHFGKSYRYVTILRDPIARTVSNYRMAAGAGMIDGSFDVFLDSRAGRRMALHNLRYFSGMADVPEDEESAALAAAERNMRRFSVLGFIEDQQSFLDKFESVFGSRPTISHYNKGKSERLDISAEQRSKLERLCAPDIALHELAKRLA